MRSSSHAVVAGLAACVLAARVGFAGIDVAGVSAAFAQSPTISFRTDDREMGTAIAAARQSLPRFIETFRTGGGERFSVKVAIPIPGGDDWEHIWISLDAIDGARFEGRLANEPNSLPGLRHGARYRADSAAISDWGYWRGGLRHGNYTTRVILKRLPASEAAQLRQTMSPEP